MSNRVSDTVRDRSIDPARGNLLSLPILAVLAAVILVPYGLLWGVGPLAAAQKDMRWWSFLATLMVGIVLHEGIHGVTWMSAGGLRSDQLKFGILWQSLTPYAHPTVPIRARAYQLGAMMPGLVLGLLPALAGLVSGNAMLTVWGTIFLALAGGDLLILIKLGRVSADALVRDHPTRFGCEILEPGEPTSP